MSIMMRTICFAALTIAAASAAQAATVKEVFEKYNLLGTFAWTCSQPANDDNNWYYVNRAIDADHVQRDRMIGPTTRGAVAILDKATESKPNEIAIEGIIDGQRFAGTWVIEKTRMLQWEATLAGKKTIAEGHLTKTGNPMPWLNRCDPPDAPK